MKIGIVGAGISGLVSLKCAIEEGHDVICFERISKLGGCWSGDGRVGNDEYGNIISSGMYKDLTTNLPKEIMYFDGHEHEPQEKSFVGQADILKYIQTYASKHQLQKYIKFGHEVMSIQPLSDDRNTRWKLVVKDLTKPKPTETDTNCEEYEFDALVVCPGHFVYKEVAHIKGDDIFKGKMLHSNDYRDAEHYKGMRVLVIGAGPSGGDIAKRVSKHATKTWQSVKPTSMRFVPVHEDVIEKVEVERFDERGAHFIDGSYETLDVVIFCTGYTYKLQCLTKECGLTIENNWFKYLYQHCINIERPTMAIIGLPYGASIFPFANLQARYYLAYLAGTFDLPNREDMLKSVMDEHEFRKSKGVPDRAFHSFPDFGRNLSISMAKEAGLKGTPNVIFNIMDSLHGSWNDRDMFKIVDDETFIRRAP